MVGYVRTKHNESSNTTKEKEDTCCPRRGKEGAYGLWEGYRVGLQGCKSLA